MGDDKKRIDLVQRYAEKLRRETPPPQIDIDAPPPPPPPPFTGARRRIEIDLGALVRAGFVPETGRRSVLAEEFRVLKRPLLMRAKTLPNGRLILVTSARPGEGKTFTAVNLGLSMASERDTAVLLIDADPRRRGLSRRLGMTAEKGLIDLLCEDGLAPESLVLDTQVPGLSLLPPGRDHPQTTELLASRRMAEVAAALLDADPRRVVLIDAPPVLATSEPSALALHAGQTLVVVEKDRTTRHAVRRTLALLENCRHVSFVLNKTLFGIGSERFADYAGYMADETK
ncbi:MAG: AAA family ATPase [Alphaproteobacteria bacterium]|nr:AAA family ATPase [Alphaproteobacteria bacterium]